MIVNINMNIVKRILDKNLALSNDFSKYGKVYLTTTENINEALAPLEIKDKKVLCVAGSSDQVLNAFFKDAESVTLFDINPLAAAQAELKFVAANKLDYDVFRSYFIPSSKSLLSKEIFNLLCSDLSPSVASYYDYLYSKFSPQEIFKKTVYPFTPSQNQLEILNNYMNEKNFKLLKNKISGKKLEFIETDLERLKDKLTDKYDAMLLSNISDYIDLIWDINTLKQYKRFIHILSKHLNPNGIIQCGYIYNSYSDQSKTPIFANNNQKRKIFTPEEFEEKEIKSFQSFGAKDKIITYQKRRTA